MSTSSAPSVVLNGEEPSSSRSSSSLSVFPSRCQSTGSLSPSSPISPKHAVISSAEINKLLDSATRFALADLLATVLRLDFYRKDDDGSTHFAEAALELILKHSDLPDKTKDSLRFHLQSDGANEDIASLISTIKTDPYVAQYGPVVTMGSILLMIIEKGDYDSRYRVLLRHVAALLGISWDDFEEVEDTLTNCLVSNYEESEAARNAREKSAKFKKLKRYALIGAASGVGGVLIGLTGGLAAPLVATGVGAIIGTTAVAGLTTATGAAILGSAFGAAGAGFAGYKMKKRVGEIEEFSVETLTEGSSLHCVLCVSGWVDEEGQAAFQRPWRHLNMSREQYTLRYESKYLLELGKALDYLLSFAVSTAIQQTLMQTALAGLVSAIAWPLVLVSSASVIDNPWNVGEHLAEVLLTRNHGRRPITLIGFSLGARVIYHCLLTMSKRSNYAGIVEDVVLLGAPVSASPNQWLQICKVVGGRVINGYCNTDWLLRFLYRTMSVQFTIAGTGPIDCKERKIKNFNVSHIVKGHLDYHKRLTEVLEAVGVRVSPRSKDVSTNNLEAANDESIPEEDALSSNEAAANSIHVPNGFSSKEAKIKDTVADSVGKENVKFEL
ncbi:Protein F35D11.3 [Aphelenchoides avenae]|nr:Protein F35D11.3 [Aphelenchus avenae]